MKLVALWVEDYRKFKNQTFNLDHPTEFIFDFDDQKRVLSISSKEKKNYVSLFEEPFTGVTAIVGKNAAGKSTFFTLLNIIKAKKSIDNPLVLVFQNNDNLHEIVVYQSIDNLYYSLKDKKRSIKVELSEQLKKSKDDKTLKLVDNDFEMNPLENLNILNYDNLFSDNNDKYLNIRDVFNRKTMYQTLLALNKESLKAYIEGFEEKEKELHSTSEAIFNPLKLYFNEKLERNLTFLALVNGDDKFPKDLINKINLPKTISIWFENEIFQDLLDIIKESKFDEKQELLINFNVFHLNLINQKIRDDYYKALKNRILLQVINFSIFYENFFENQPKYFTNDFFELIENRELDENLIVEIESFLIDNVSKKGLDCYKVLLLYGFDRLILDIDEFLRDIIISSDTLTIYGLNTIFEVQINSDIWTFIKSLLSLNPFGSRPFFNYQFTNLSSGEDALLNQYTELYNGINFSQNNTDLLILIDEGEINLHPEWQREYLSSLIVFVRYYAIKKNLKVQLILSTHSPFMLSDLTKNQVIFLNHINDSKRLGISINQSDKIETFGANIYDLFKDSFFMENGFIGQFAKQKIDNIFEDLSNDKKGISVKRKVEIKKIISIIGEPLIKRQLSKMYDEIYNEGLELDAIDEQMKRLAELKIRIKKKRSKENDSN